MYNWQCYSDRLYANTKRVSDVEIQEPPVTMTFLSARIPDSEPETPQEVARPRRSGNFTLPAAENHFRTMLDNVHLIAVMLDKAGAITYINDHCLRLTGWQRAEVIGRNWFDLFIPPDGPVREVFAEFVSSGEIVPHYTNDILTRSGARRTISWNNTILRSADGQVIGTTSIGEDITDRLQAEARLRDSEEKYSKLFHHSNDAIVIHEIDGRILDVNDQALTLWGYTREEMLTLRVADLHPPLVGDDGLPPIARAGSQRAVHYETEAVRKDGQVFLAEVSTNRLEWSGRQIAQKIVRDVTTRRLAERAMAEARDEALEASRIKSDFLATMSHEIRTPLNGITGMAELLHDTALDSEQREFVSIILSEAEALLAIINDILDFSKIEAGHVRLTPSSFDLAQVVEATADVLAPKARQQRLSLVTYVSPELPPILVGDGGRLRQVLLNLLGNAVKFTPAGEVVLRAQIEARTSTRVHVRFTVTDTGIGIADSDQHRLFQPFTQVDSSRSRRYGGTGLGLAISRRLVELMGGTMGVVSSGIPGQGSTFWFTAWFEQAPDEHHQQPRVLPRAVRALLVTPSAAQRDVLSAYLTAWGATVDTAASDSQALALLNRNPASHVYDMVLIDGDLPAITTHNFAQDPAQSPSLPRTCLILLTAPDDLRRSIMVTELGFDVHLMKPVKQARLFDTVWQIATAVPGTGNRQELSRETAAPKAEQPSNKMILLVEDNETNRILVMRQLTRLGCAVEVAADGVAAVSRMAAAQQGGRAVDLIFMDVQMPGMDGLQATRLIRQTEAIHGGHVPIVAMTAYATEEDRQQCLAAGMDDYLAKPVTLVDLQQVLARQID